MGPQIARPDTVAPQTQTRISVPLTGLSADPKAARSRKYAQIG